MMIKVHSMFIKSAALMAGLAIMLATFNVNSTCLFLSYQPDVPEELK